jgi:group I intron endonuclease
VISGIYSITSPSGKFYIGSTVDFEKRWSLHKRDLSRGNHKNRYLQNAWNKYNGRLSFLKLIVCRRVDLLLYEQLVIDRFRPEYNLSPCASNTLGLKWSEESKARQSKRMLGTKDSEETRRRKSEKLRGRLVSEDTREKIRTQKGWKHTEAAKKKMRGRTFSRRSIGKT